MGRAFPLLLEKSVQRAEAVSALPAEAGGGGFYENDQACASTEDRAFAYWAKSVRRRRKLHGHKLVPI